MKIKPDFNKASEYFENISHSESKDTLYKRVSRAVSLALMRLSKTLQGITNERMWEDSKKQLRNCSIAISFVDKPKAPVFSEDLYLFAAKEKFKSILKEAATLYFEKKISTGEETIDSLRAKLKSKGSSIKEIVRGAKDKNILSNLPLQEVSGFLALDPKLKAEWDDFFSELKYYFEFTALSLQDTCEKKFLELFSSKEINAEGSWRLCLAKTLSPVKEEYLPEFAKDKLREAREFLPEGFDDKVRIWQKSQDHIQQVVQKKIEIVKTRIFAGFDLPSTLRTPDSEFEPRFLTEKAASSQAYKYTELMPTCPEGGSGSDAFLLSYLSKIIELIILQQTFIKYRGQITDGDFFEAYSQWDQFAKDPIELEQLIEAKIAEVKSAK